MSTAGSTSMSSSASGAPRTLAGTRSPTDSAARKRGYVPGSRVVVAAESNTVKRPRRRQSRAPAPYLPSEVMEKITDLLVKMRAGGSVIILGMVNRAFHQHVDTSHPMWYALYLQWRGPVTYPSSSVHPLRPYAHGNPMAMAARVPTVARLVPTTPRTLPNFRTRSLSIR